MAQNLFGTDGIRGVANEEPLTPETLVKIGKAIAFFFLKKNGTPRKKIVIGKDTRLSGYMLETALTSGIVSMGVDVLLVGPLPTPAIAHLTKSLNADAGIVLSASHNPARDNGVKIFGSNGIKISEKDEKEIEILVENNSFKNSVSIGKAFRIDDARGRYIEFVKASISSAPLNGLKVVVDCANGAAYSMAKRIFEELGVKVNCINDIPDGENINKDCGALYPQSMQKVVQQGGFDAGIAFDGDADRVIFCDEKGEIVFGEQIMGIFALDLKNSGKLKNNSIVATRISNTGFFEAMKKNGVKVIECDVGDKNVIETMVDKHAIFGAEPSGHIIFSDCSTTGDGLIGALNLLLVMKKNGQKLSEMKKIVTLYPQAQLNVKVKERKPFDLLKKTTLEIKNAEKNLKGNGRVIVRYSGTEKKARVLVEAKQQSIADESAQKIANAIREEVGA